MNLPYSAMEAWNEGLKLRNNDFRLNWNMADTLAHLGFLDESMRFYERVKESAIPETAEVQWTKRVDEQIAKLRDIKEKSIIAKQNQIIEQAKIIKQGKT